MATKKKILLISLIIYSVILRPGVAQETQESFATDLISACQENNVIKVQDLISEHRIWVKPAVDNLITEYIGYKLAGKETAASQSRGKADLIAKVFKDTFGEESLVIATNYLDSWNKEDLKKKTYADSLLLLAFPIRNKEQEHEQAMKLYNEALYIYREIGDERGMAEIHGALGLIQYYRTLWFNEDPQIVLDQYEISLLAREKVDDQEMIGRSLNDIGLVYRVFFKNYEKAIVYLERAAEIRSEIGDRQRLGSTLLTLAYCYEYNMQYEAALKAYDQAYEIFKGFADKSKMASARINSAVLMKNRGDYQKALEYLYEALEIRQELDDPAETGHVLNWIGVVYSRLGSYDKAIELYLEVTGIMKDEGNRSGESYIYNNIGILLAEAGRFEKALEYYKLSQEISEDINDFEGLCSSWTNMGNVYSDLGDYEQAVQVQIKALNLSREMNFYDSEIINLINLSGLEINLGKLDSALHHGKLALELATELDSPPLIWVATLNIGEYYEQQEDYLMALEHFDKALDIIEEIRASLLVDEFKTDYMARERYVFESVIHMLGTLHGKDPDGGYDAKAFLYAEKSKSRTFLDMLTESLSMRKKLVDFQPASVKEIQSTIPDDHSILLEYFLGDSSSCLWIITNSAYRLVVLPGRNELKDDIETIRFSLTQPDETNTSFFSGSSSSLYEQLLKPAEQYLEKGKNLIIIPDGELFYLPFEVLLTEQPEKAKDADFGSLPYLIKKYPISYSPSSTILMNLKSKIIEEKEGVPDLMAFGDPLFQSEYVRLEYSAQELRGIGSKFSVGHSDLFLRDAATEDRVKSMKLDAYEYIHFATHGVINEKLPDASCLVLSKNPGGNEDGLLHASEIRNLKLNADLVVLSACNSGLGKMIRGEGMVGFTRAFIYSGASSILVSLWSVADQSTARFMIGFYENLLTNGMNKSIALQKSQLSFIGDAEFAHPFFWAPFVLIGNWR